MNSTQVNPRFELKASKRIEVVSYDVAVDGETIGKVEVSGCYTSSLRWHAHFARDRHELIQGHGSTPEEAIATAFIDSREKLEKSLADLDELQAIMIPTGDEEPQAEF